MKMEENYPRIHILCAMEILERETKWEQCNGKGESGDSPNFSIGLDLQIFFRNRCWKRK